MESIKVELAQLAPGMRLSEPVYNSSGTTLMPAGIRLTPMFIVRLKKWGVAHVVVEREAPAAPQPEKTSGPSVTRQIAAAAQSGAGPEPSQFALEIAREVALRFANVQSDPLMQQLRVITVKKLLAHGEEGVLNVMRRAARDATGGTRQNGN